MPVLLQKMKLLEQVAGRVAKLGSLAGLGHATRTSPQTPDKYNLNLKLWIRSTNEFCGVPKLVLC